MAREKITHLFNRNHIEIIRIEHPELTNMTPKYPKDEHISSSTYKYNHTLYPEKIKYETVKKVSKLGFYYTSQVRIKKKSELYNGGISRRVITFPYGNEVYYQLKYVTSCGENKIGGEDGLRPWDIYPGDKDFPDSMLNALLKEVELFFINAKEAKVKEFHYALNSTPTQIDSLKRSVYKDLFGNEKGPRFQTNEEKIFAHGFDLKTSFRKSKEEKT